MLVISFGVRLALDIITTLLHVVSIGLTLLRLHYRRSTSRLGWDDYTAALAIIVDTAYFVVLWPVFSVVKFRNLQISRRNKYWLNVELFFLIICLCRMSISLAIARIFPAKECTRRFMIGLAVFFGFMFVALQLTTICGTPTLSPTVTDRSKCQWVYSLKLSYIFINIIADLFLVGLPLYKLWRVRLPIQQRKLILAGFAASSIMTFGAAACAVVQLAPSSWEPARSQLRLSCSYMEAAVCLAACNLLVIITYFDNIRRRAPDHANRSSRRMYPLEARRAGGQLLTQSTSGVPSSTDIYSGLVLTETTDAFVTVDAESSQETSFALTSSFISIAEEELNESQYYHQPRHRSDPPNLS